jgi:ferredoxin
MATTIYYFTGTGNSLKIASDLAGALGESRLTRISSAASSSSIKATTDCIGIVFPVYVDGLPRIVESFARNLTLAEGTYVFSVATYGGGAGGSLVQLDDILKTKGAGLSAAFGVKMPDNTQILFPPCAEGEQQDDFRRAEESVRVIAAIVRERRTAIDEIDMTRRRLGPSWTRPPFDPTDMAKKFWVDERCNGCGLCERICPVDNVSLGADKPVWLDRCEQCAACMQWCPNEAIQFGKKTTTWGRYHHPAIAAAELFRQD